MAMMKKAEIKALLEVMMEVFMKIIESGDEDAIYIEGQIVATRLIMGDSYEEIYRDLDRMKTNK